mmetsp:Transcript_9243/g.23719  ORF Transcript_9243/g.23719 Transcript_9243/m.23719 type:complete len:247 (+) Transcript_9243:1708-2448(+)
MVTSPTRRPSHCGCSVQRTSPAGDVARATRAATTTVHRRCGPTRGSSRTKLPFGACTPPTRARQPIPNRRGRSTQPQAARTEGAVVQPTVEAAIFQRSTRPRATGPRRRRALRRVGRLGTFPAAPHWRLGCLTRTSTPGRGRAGSAPPLERPPDPSWGAVGSPRQPRPPLAAVPTLLTRSRLFASGTVGIAGMAPHRARARRLPACLGLAERAAELARPGSVREPRGSTGQTGPLSMAVVEVGIEA